MTKLRTLLPVVAACSIGALLLPARAWAQAGVSTSGNPAQIQQPGFGKTPKSKSESERPGTPPPALPGSRAEQDVVAPPTKVVTDMPPTEALFDAINRGDLATARDSVGRGADLNGRNVLGLTPIELAVDLGRNQISFYLLSLRGGVSAESAGGPPAPVKAPTRAERLAADRQAAAEARAERQAAARVAVTAPAAPQTARLFAGNGGAPVPQAGFLGFDSTR